MKGPKVLFDKISAFNLKQNIYTLFIFLVENNQFTLNNRLCTPYIYHRRYFMPREFTLSAEFIFVTFFIEYFFCLKIDRQIAFMTTTSLLIILGCTQYKCITNR